ncbi:MAG: ribosomal protein S18-alanine N-acetyltransferase [Sandaracinaceae bacterium]
MSAWGTPTIRELEPRDVEPASRIAARCFDSDTERPSFPDELGRSIAHCWVAERDGVLVGYALAWIVADRAELMSIGVDADARGGGIGRALLGHVLGRSAALGARELVLEVRASNAAAIALYHAAGLTRIGQRPRYYRDGEDALVYARSLTPGST